VIALQTLNNFWPFNRDAMVPFERAIVSAGMIMLQPAAGTLAVAAAAGALPSLLLPPMLAIL
jgi:hypothetical protein